MSSDSRDLSPDCWNSFRRFGIQPTKTILATVADIAGDWVFYFAVLGFDSDDDTFDKFELPLLVFAIVSSVMGFLLFVSLIMDFRVRRKQRSPRRKCFGILVKRILGVEIFFEDIPQFVLTAMITAERGALSGYAVFNISTSATNFVLNMLDMIEVEDEDDGINGEQKNGSGGAHVY